MIGKIEPRKELERVKKYKRRVEPTHPASKATFPYKYNVDHSHVLRQLERDARTFKEIYLAHKEKMEKEREIG